MTHDEMIAVIAHHKNGGTIQSLSPSGKWSDLSDSSISWNFTVNTYRAKPEPLVLWGVFFANGGFATASRTEDGAREAAQAIGAMMEIQKFVEEEVK
jgi:hypothetical protein